MAEREGFEPSVEVSPYTRLAGERLQPTRPSLQNPTLNLLAEGVGFEPTSRFRETVFKTAAFNHSAIPPGSRLGGLRFPVFRFRCYASDLICYYIHNCFQVNPFIFCLNEGSLHPRYKRNDERTSVLLSSAYGGKLKLPVMRGGCFLSVFKRHAIGSWNLKPTSLTVSFFSYVGGYIWVCFGRQQRKGARKDSI